MIHHLLERAAGRFGHRVAILAGGRGLSFQELDGLANATGRHLASAGVGPGDRVAVMMSNRPEFLSTVFAVSKLGAASVLLSPAWKALEVEHAVATTEPAHAVVDTTAAPLLADSLGIDHVTDIDDQPGRGDDRSALEPVAADPRHEAVLVFSSGTTGTSKAVRHTHGSMSWATRHWCAALGLGPDDRFQVATPPSHILGLLNLLAAAAAGATVRLHRRFDLEEVLSRIANERMTLEMAVAPIALSMANHPHLEDYDLSSLRYIMWGATPVTPSVAETVTGRTGVRWLPAYGASELPVLAANPVDEPSRWRLDSAGLPPRGVELRIADLETGEPLEHGGVGEIQARSRSVMAGYLPKEANSAAFVEGPGVGAPQRWYRTGDVGWLEPEGWVHITDRCKEMIKVSGFQVAPAEIEGVLLGHPSVVDCAVFGVADERSGEVPVAAVELQAGASVAAEELMTMVAMSLATYKHLHKVVVVDSVPRLPSGKVLRRRLREEWEPRLRAGRR